MLVILNEMPFLKLKHLHQNTNVIMVGGSGLYVKAVTKGLDYFPEVDATIRTT